MPSLSTSRLKYMADVHCDAVVVAVCHGLDRCIDEFVQVDVTQVALLNMMDVLCNLLVYVVQVVLPPLVLSFRSRNCGHRLVVRRLLLCPFKEMQSQPSCHPLGDE